MERSQPVVVALEYEERGPEPYQHGLYGPESLWRNRRLFQGKSTWVAVSHRRGLSYPRVPACPRAGCPQVSDHVCPVVVDNWGELSTRYDELSTTVDNPYIGSAG